MSIQFRTTDGLADEPVSRANPLPVTPTGQSASAVTPSDTDTLAAARGLYVGGAGDVAIETAAGDTLTFTAVPAGTFLPIAAVKVLATGTDATNIVALS
jgi:hypothetical protein